MIARLRSLRLFGSQARGDAGDGSDADVSVVFDRVSDDERCEAIDLATNAWREHLGPPLSPLIWSGEDEAEMVRLERRIALDIQRESIAV